MHLRIPGCSAWVLVSDLYTVLLSKQVVFGQEEKALQVLSPLIGVIPEAVLNAVILHLRQGECHLLYYNYTSHTCVVCTLIHEKLQLLFL